jgi:transcriptional regulator with XRE-family HTH domain
MEMVINKEKLISEKNKRAWTQGHLAEVCGVSLRTIQRIEKTGIASHDTIKALASVFELSIEELINLDLKEIFDSKHSEENTKKEGAFNYFTGWINGKRIAVIALLFILSLVILLTVAYFNRRNMMMTMNGIPFTFSKPRSSYYELISILSFFTLLPGVILLSIAHSFYKYNKHWSYWLILAASIVFIVANIKFGFLILLFVFICIKWSSKKYT